MAKIDAFFKLMNEQGASDLHLVAGSQPVLRVHGDMERVKYKELENDELKSILYEIAPEDKIKIFEETGDIDFAYEIPNLARYRANYFQQKWGVGAVFREIPSEILTVEQLGLPSVISKLSMLHKGIVLVTGPTGSGKSTTLAAMIDYINNRKKSHIITIEDPVEFVHKNKNCIINHREVGIHTQGFKSATPILFWWVKCAIWKPSSWLSKRLPPDTLFSAPCTPKARLKPSTVSSMFSRLISKRRSARPYRNLLRE